MKKLTLLVGIVLFVFISNLLIAPPNALGNQTPAISLSLKLPKEAKAGIPFNAEVSINGTNKEISTAVWFESSDPALSVPDPFSFNNSQDKHSFKFVAFKAEDLLIRVFLVSDPSIYSEREVKVLPSDPVKLSVTPIKIAMGIGDSYMFSANAYDKYNNKVDNIRVSWEVVTQNGGFGTIKDGVFTATKTGKCLIVGKAGALRAVSIVEIRDSVITNLSIQLSPSKIHSFPQYKISFNNRNELIRKGDPIYIIFTDQFSFPCTCHKIIRGSEISINGNACLKDPKISYEPRAMEIFSPIAIPPNKKVEIIINSSAEIKTPFRRGLYKIGIAFSISQTPIFKEVSIDFDGISEFSVKTVPDVSGCYADWVISFRIGKDSYIKKNGSIVFFFPEEVEIPEHIEPSSVLLNGKELPTNSISTNNLMHFVKILFPVSVYGGETVKIVFSKKARIRTPYMPGNYQLEVEYPDDMTPTASGSFYVKFLPVLDVSCTVKGKKVSKNLFNSMVSVSFEGFSNIPADDFKIYYSLNSSKMRIYQQEDITLSDGKYNIDFFEKSAYGIITNINSVAFTADTTPPKIVIDNFVQGEKVHAKYFKISGSVSEDTSKLYINGIKVPISSKGKFIQLLSLDEGKNSIYIMAEDSASNIAKLNLNVFYIPVQPYLHITLGKDVRYGFTTLGYVDMKIETNKNSVLTILTASGPSIFHMGNSNVFYYRVPLDLGKNIINIYSEDVNGDTLYKQTVIERVNGLIILKSISGECFISKNRKTYSSEIIIRKGRSFIGTFLFSGILGEKVSILNGGNIISTKRFIVNIKKETLMVNGKEYKFPKSSRPFYKEGKIMLPVRFILERIGYRIVWVRKDKVIVIFY